MAVSTTGWDWSGGCRSSFETSSPWLVVEQHLESRRRATSRRTPSEACLYVSREQRANGHRRLVLVLDLVKPVVGKLARAVSRRRG
jgi:hypothetical protein